jgi:hypothetical protein
MLQKTVPMPPRIAKLPQDHRGYPIPVSVLRDREGRPHFTINDEQVNKSIRSEYRCGICGEKLDGDVWFVGGPASAFHAQGRYFDSAVHHDCGQYALKVCPYLAVPSYGRRIDDATLKDKSMHVLIDATQDDRRPIVFVLARTTTYTIDRDNMPPVLNPRRPWKEVEFWRFGEQLTQEKAEEMMRADSEDRYPLDGFVWWRLWRTPLKKDKSSQGSVSTAPCGEAEPKAKAVQAEQDAQGGVHQPL